MEDPITVTDLENGGKGPRSKEYGPPSEPESQQENRELHHVSPATCKSEEMEILETLECDRAPIILVLSL